jgi:hypothetical protein
MNSTLEWLVTLLPMLGSDGHLVRDDLYSYWLVSGFGFGLTSGLIEYIGPLVHSYGPGILICSSCPYLDVFFVSGKMNVFHAISHGDFLIHFSTH